MAIANLLIAIGADIRDLQAKSDESVAAMEKLRASVEAQNSSWTELAAKYLTAKEALHLVEEAAHAVAEELSTLVIEGSKVAHVEDAFDNMTAAAGRSAETLMGALKDGTRGTIGDFELMQSANRDLAAGLNLTDAQFRTLAEGAFALGHATSESTLVAFEQMNDAMLTGRVKALAFLTGKIDLKDAEDKYARSLDTTVDKLTSEQKQEVDRLTILGRIEVGLGRVGEVTEGLDDRVAQVSVTWDNFHKELGETIARSPVLAGGFDTLRKALQDAFGGSQATLIANITQQVEDGAIVVTDFGIAAIEAGRVFHTVWSTIETLVLSVESGLLAAGAAAVSAYAAIAKATAFTPGDKAAAATAQATADSMWALAHGVDAEAQEAARGVAGTSAFDRTLDKLGGTLLVTRDRLKALQLATKPLDAELFVGPQQPTGPAAAAGNGMNAEEWKKFKAAEDEVNAAGIGWRGTLASIDDAVLSSMRSLNAAGVSVSALTTYYGLSATQGHAFELMLRDEVTTLRNTAANIATVTGLWNEYNLVIAKTTGTAVDQQIAAIDKWAADVSAKQTKLLAEGKVTAAEMVDFTAALTATSKAKTDALLTDWQALTATATTDTKAGLQQIADKARSTFEQALAHVGTFTEGAIQHFRDLSDAAQAAVDHWGEAIDTLEPAGVQAAAAIGSAFGSTWQRISAGADSMASHVLGVLAALTDSDAYTKAGFILQEGFGTASRINQQALSNIGITRPGNIGLGGAVAGLGAGANVTINAGNSFYDTPAGQQQFFGKVNVAVVAALKQAGIKVS